MNTTYDEYIQSPQWKAKRGEAFNHYGKRCSLCGAKSKLQIHHIHYRNFRHEKVEDLTVLCESCHNAYEKRKRRRGSGDQKTYLLTREIGKTKRELKKTRWQSAEFLHLTAYLAKLKKELVT